MIKKTSISPPTYSPMIVYPSIDAFPNIHSSLSLTIGNFDGVHLGHHMVLKRLCEVAERRCVLTFLNHPASILGRTQVPLLTTLEHRLRLLEQNQVDSVLLLPFTQEFAQQSSLEFLTKLKRHLPLTHLILGHDASIGHDQNRELSAHCQKLQLHLEYLPPKIVDGAPISSSRIRAAIQNGEFSKANSLLGRPYTISTYVSPGAQKGRGLGFHTANLDVSSLALPPLGVYAVKATLSDGTLYNGVANLGIAPTLHTERTPQLEVHLFDCVRDLYNKTLTVQLCQFLRAEQKFTSPQALKDQIHQDILSAKKVLATSHTETTDTGYTIHKK